MTPESHEITRLLKAWGAGDKIALDQLIPLVYEQLHRLAERRMANEKEGDTLQATALVHEAYLRLVNSDQATWNDRTHFFAVCARLMRNILIDAARSRHALKRGSGMVVQLDYAVDGKAEPAIDLIAIGDALDALAAIDARKSQVMEMRIFGGLSARETAGILRISTDTVTRDMDFATAWLRRELGRENRHGT